MVYGERVQPQGRGKRQDGPFLVYRLLCCLNYAQWLLRCLRHRGDRGAAGETSGHRRIAGAWSNTHASNSRRLGRKNRRRRTTTIKNRRRREAPHRRRRTHRIRDAPTSSRIHQRNRNYCIWMTRASVATLAYHSSLNVPSLPTRHCFFVSCSYFPVMHCKPANSNDARACSVR